VKIEKYYLSFLTIFRNTSEHIPKNPTIKGQSDAREKIYSNIALVFWNITSGLLEKDNKLNTQEKTVSIPKK